MKRCCDKNTHKIKYDTPKKKVQQNDHSNKLTDTMN